MATNYEGAVRAGTLAAARAHSELGTRNIVESSGGNVDIFGVISGLELPLMLRPLKGLLGAYLDDPVPGIIITTERRMSIQRFTAAHEFGHFWMKHQPSLDDEGILRRMPNSPEPTGLFQETEADAFAIGFMMPKWLILGHAVRQGWQKSQFRRPDIVYQLSLRLGASYEATCRTLVRYSLIDVATMDTLLASKPRAQKVALLSGYVPADYRGDVWLLTVADAGTRIEGSRDDIFVVQLAEHSGGGYVWDFDQLVASGFVIAADHRAALDPDGVGGPVVRRITASVDAADRGRVSLEERRPWQPAPPASALTFEFDMTGPEPAGLSRADRRRFLEAA
ncbi:ImmA/IrrE family metallo-endopeptidase [Erythrobacter sp. SN021]|uniref:ImmA/IrrE family metallo-endopeptidase n=1 Tax=Erythrobacter sp. SN021 TaxID=2912574 RepID=UPI001F20D185|nr:ImmA/IrrE family metallo-endopeptidase [Erythrobacter sp. SN021]MCF8883423.1 ImmA/IrrE family metallo-endopeptidase [Erythrobacter sp. SN021]